MIDLLALLGIGGLLGWAALPVLYLVARGPKDASPDSRHRALSWALGLSAALVAAPLLRQALTPAVRARLPQALLEASTPAPATALTVRATFPPLAAVGALFVALLALGLLIWLVRSIRVARLVRGESAPPAELLARVDRLSREFGVLPPEITVSNTAGLPFVTALPTPRLVLPALLLEALGDDALELVLRHELCHLARRDHRSALWVALARIPFTLHPLMPALARELELAREMAVDLRLGAVAPRAYASLLLDVAELHRFGPREAGEVALHPASLERRIDMLTRTSPRRTARLLPLLGLSALLAGAVLAAPAFAEPSAAPASASTLSLRTGQQTTLTVPGVTRLAVGDPGVADIKVGTGEQVIVVGVAPGQTTVLAWDGSGKRRSWTVLVTR